MKVTVHWAATAPSDSPESQDAARHVDGDDGQAAFGRRRENRGNLGVERAAQARTEQRIDDELRTVERARLERLERPAPALCMMRGVAAQALARTQERHPNRPAA